MTGPVPNASPALPGIFPETKSMFSRNSSTNKSIWFM